MTILFSDIEGSTPLIARLGDQAWVRLLRQHDDIWCREVAAHGGSVVKHRGDGFMVAFDEAGDGLRCAVAVQRALAKWNRENERAVRVRVGLHEGESVCYGTDFYGKHVNVAARIMRVAAAGEILVSSAVRASVGGPGEFSFGRRDSVELKGFDGEYEVHAVEWAAERERVAV